MIVDVMKYCNESLTGREPGVKRSKVDIEWVGKLVRALYTTVVGRNARTGSGLNGVLGPG